MHDDTTTPLDVNPKPPEEPAASGFEALDLAPEVQQAIRKIGYEQPSPIQSQSIPHLLAGRDLLGVAQTGTGKTAAFALPLLSRLDLSKTKPQVLVLAPTRELAIQVSEAFQRYASHMKGFHVLPIYGGQEYHGQLRQLSRGVHVVVGTPGRVMDHITRKSLVLDELQALVLDEADEMLRMGFLDDVEWILQHTPDTRQIALFSATMPRQIQKVAETYLKNPSEVRIKAGTATVELTEQRAVLVHGHEKLDALTRLLETADFDGMLVFVRTKTATVELAERIEARGFACAPLNGDMTQQARERTVGRFKSGKLDVVIATDVAARGIDVPRITHVINYDIPYDAEAYIHRIGRTGRAGRDGTAITFVTARESRLLLSIERATRSPVEWLKVPGREQLAERRIKAFKQQIQEVLDGDEDLEFFRKLIQDYSAESSCETVDAAAALAFLQQRHRPLQPPPDKLPPRPLRQPPRGQPGDRPQRSRPSDSNLETYRIQVGREHGINPGHIVGAIANEAGLDSSNIGRIQLFDKYSTVDLPRGMPPKLLQHLQKVRIFQQPLNIERDAGARPAGRPAARFDRPGKFPDRERPGRPGGPKPFKPGGAKPFQPGGAKPFKAGASKPSSPSAPGPAKPFQVPAERPIKLSPAKPSQAPASEPFKPAADKPFRVADSKPFKPGAAKPFKPGAAKPVRPGGSRPAAPRDRLADLSRLAGEVVAEGGMAAPKKRPMYAGGPAGRPGKPTPSPKGKKFAGKAGKPGKSAGKAGKPVRPKRPKPKPKA